MFIIFFLLHFWLLFLFFFYKDSQELRLSLIKAVVTQGIETFFITEFLSYFNALTFSNVLYFWIIVSLTIVGISVFTNKKIFKQSLNFLIVRFKKVRVTPDTLILLTFTILILGITFFLSIYVPPNNWDSLTYHLVRVEHWIQNQNVNFYPSNIDKQLYMGPFMEFTLLHLKLLWGKESIFNLLQWFSAVLSFIGVSFITKKLDAQPFQQIIAVFFCASIPIGILESSTTQNDYFVSMLLVCSYCFLINYCKKKNWQDIIFLSLSLGLAFLTKPTSYFFTLPLLTGLFVKLWKQGKAHFLKKVSLVLSITILINFNQYRRNFETYGSIFGTPNGITYTVISQDPTVYISNFLKNASLNLIFPEENLNRSIKYYIQAIHTNILKIDLNDPRTSFMEEKFNPSFSTSEETAGNGVQLILILLSFLVTTLQIRDRKETFTYALAVSLGFLGICTVLIWQPWATRLHLPFFVLISPLVGIATTKLPKLAVLACCGVIFITTIPFLLKNQGKPLLGENTIFAKTTEELRFAANPEILNPYKSATTFVANHNFKTVGIYQEADAWEYPLWKELKEVSQNEIFIENYNVQDESKKIPQTTKIFEAVICIYCEQIENRKVFSDYSNREVFGDISVFYSPTSPIYNRNNTEHVF